MDIVKLSRELMYKQTQKNKSPAWLLTEIAVKKGKELSKKYNVDERLVLTSLYLAHTIFTAEFEHDTTKNHPELSAEFAKKYLNEWKVSKKEQEIILNAIEAHHNKVPAKSKIAEVMKNAECFKFVTVEGSLIWLHELGIRKVSYDEAVKRVIQKMEEKKKLITLPELKEEVENNCKEIKRLFGH